jgi:hypothetical protein
LIQGIYEDGGQVKTLTDMKQKAIALIGKVQKEYPSK